MIKLAQIAVLPVHTDGVERGFSAQNLICTSKRNRLNVDTQNMLIKRKLEGQAERSEAYIASIVKRWQAKDRK